MRKWLTIVVIFLMRPVSSMAADGDYAVSKISQDLLKNAHVVKRFEEIKYEISSLSKVKIYHRYAITILDENGDQYASFYAYYDKLRSIESINGRLYDANGKKIKSLKSGDIQDRSGVSDESLMEDDRLKMHNFYYKVYPYTIEYEVEILLNNSYFFLAWVPQPAESYAVEESSYSVVCPANITFHFKAFNYNKEPVINEEKNIKTYTWKVKDVLPIVKEYAAPVWQTLTTCVFFSPDKFEVSGYKGEMTSWQTMGQFIYQLNKGRDQLPQATKQKVHQLTDHISDPREKIRILYEYMQKNTRYISIQLGIGGWQPFDATQVATKSYGDCKALSNYMYALLKEVNIKSCYTLINSGRGENFFMPDFPNNRFDHIILNVPLEKDTIWLECTSQTLPAGYLSSFTEDRYALAVKEDGGYLVHTPRYGLADNLEKRKLKAVLDESASLAIHANSIYKGLEQDDVHNLINSLSRDKVKEYLEKQLDFPTYDLDKFEYKETKSAMPEIEESLDLLVSNYANITGKRLFIIPNVMNRSEIKLKEDTARKYDIVLHHEHRLIDSIEIEIPKGYKPESIPQPVSIQNKFGKYYSAVKLGENKIEYYRLMEQYSGQFPAADYTELVSFYETIYKADRNKVVFIKNE